MRELCRRMVIHFAWRVGVDVAVERGSVVHDATWCNMPNDGGKKLHQEASIEFLPSAPSGGLAN